MARNNILMFDPPFHRFVEVLFLVFEKITKAVLMLPRVETTKGFNSYQGEPILIKVMAVSIRHR